MSSSLIDTFGRAAQQLADQRNRPLQSALHLLHARGGYVSSIANICSLSKKSSVSFASPAPLGIDKIRLTGGEPLMRRDLARLVALLAAVPGIKDIGLTTNGILLAEHAQPLYDAGLRRINVSLDALSPERFRQLARRDGVDKVLAGIEAAKRAGFKPIKINAVSIRGVTEHEVVPLARVCA